MGKSRSLVNLVIFEAIFCSNRRRGLSRAKQFLELEGLKHHQFILNIRDFEKIKALSLEYKKTTVGYSKLSK
jgi:hypothetical protein